MEVLTRTIHLRTTPADVIFAHQRVPPGSDPPGPPAGAARHGARPAGPARDTPPGGNAAGGRDRGRPGRVPLVRGDRGVGDRPAAWGAGGPRRVGRVPAGEVVPAAAVRPGRRRRPGPGPRGVDVHPYRRTGRAAGDRDRRQNGPRRPHRERGGPASGRRPGPHHRQPGTPSWGRWRSPRRATRSLLSRPARHLRPDRRRHHRRCHAHPDRYP